MVASWAGPMRGPLARKPSGIRWSSPSFAASAKDAATPSANYDHAYQDHLTEDHQQFHSIASDVEEEEIMPFTTKLDEHKHLQVDVGSRTATLRGVLGRKTSVEKLWEGFFRDPAQWWDHRLEKQNARYPDFKHKKTQESLWLNGKFKPPWVEAELAKMAPGSIHQNVYGWNTRLGRHFKAGQFEKTIEIFHQMQQEGIDPDRYTFTPVINACSNLRDITEGRRIHTQVMQSGLEQNLYVSSSLIDMYAKCGSIEDAWDVFKKMPTRDVVVWNAMILGYVKSGQGRKALALSAEMQRQGVGPVSVTFVGLINACASLRSLEEGRLIHTQIIQTGCESDVYVGSSLVDMYLKCGNVKDAWEVFWKVPRRDVVSWNAMIQGFVRCGQGHDALELFRRMQQEGVEPDSVTFVGVLNACASVAALEEGKLVHELIIRRDCESDGFVGNSLVVMYAKCGSLDDAWRVFNKLPSRDVVAWSSIILGHVKCGEWQKALQIFRQMEGEGVEPDAITFVGVLNACAGIISIEEGRRYHERIMLRGFESDIFVASSLIDMYAKCGSIEDASKIFNKILKRNVVCWNAMILGHVKCGQGLKALECSRKMQLDGVDPDPVTFVGMLNACASVAALEEGRNIHKQVIQSGWESDIFVGNSLVDMYAKCGNMRDALRVFNKMDKNDAVSWNAVLGGYAMHGHAKQAVAHFKLMCQNGIEMNTVTFVSLLSACSHGGLVEDGLVFFEAMSPVYNVSATTEHYTCMVDLLGRAGRLHEAEDLMKISCDPGTTLLTSLLGACRVHGSLEMGKRIAKQILELNPGDSAAYVVLSNIYAAAGQWDSSDDIQRLRLMRGAKKESECTWIEVGKVIHSFTTDDQQHSQMTQICSEINRLLLKMQEVGYVAETRSLLHDSEEQEQPSLVCRHSEKLAVAF